MIKKSSLLLCVSVINSVNAFAEQSTINPMETMVVTATREEKSKRELSESVTAYQEETIKKVSPSHPSEIVNRTSGVYINNLGGEGHMTAIRQPITTRGVYLFLQDGVPVRPTGFFNHNALYEVNIPQSGNLEVVKGPGSALYGSDAIGGLINTISAAPPSNTTFRLNAELGSHGWNRTLFSAGGTSGRHSGILKLNYTDNEGFRDESDYDRTSVDSRWDIDLDGVAVKTLLSYTKVDQSGASSLEGADYRHDTEKNRFHGNTGFRDVEALRLSTDIAIDLNANSLLSIIPFYRNNTTKMSPSWMVTYDPNERESQFESFGVLSKYRHNLSDTTQLILGFDIDYTPSAYKEEAVNFTAEGDIYLGFTSLGHRNYDFEAQQTSLSPYLHLETALSDRLTTSVGLRYDYFHVDYKDRLGDSVAERVFIPQLNRPVTHRRLEDQDISFDQLSPKLGLVYQFTELHNMYINYRHAFTVPSVGTLFRSGTTLNTDELEPIKAKSMEIGFRGLLADWLAYEVALYHMSIKDDLVSVVNGFERNMFNAGETEHNGIELTLKGNITDEFAYAMAFTRTEQTYESFSYTCCFPSRNIDVTGNDVGKAPETIGNLTLVYTPEKIDGLRIELEWEHLGEYFTDETNTATYDGHDLYNLRIAYRVNDKLEVYSRLQNLIDELYSTYTSNQVGDPDISYRPGLPRSYFAGVQLTF